MKEMGGTVMFNQGMGDPVSLYGFDENHQGNISPLSVDT